MDSPSEEYSRLSLTVALALLSVWSVISLAHAYDRRLAETNESLTEALRIVGRLNVIADALDHLCLDQRAFLFTGEETFQDGVVESIETLELNIDMLNSLAAQSPSHRALLFELSQSIEQVIGSVGESDRIREMSNKAAAVAFFDSKEAEISQAILQTNQLRLEIVLFISNRIRSHRSSEAVFGALLDDARRWQHVVLSNSAHHPELTETVRLRGSQP